MHAHHLLLQAYINEQAAPELLPYRDDLVERMTQHIQDQEQRLEALTEEGNHELARTLLDWQVSRARFLVRRYLRARLLKIQGNTAFVLDSSEHTARLSERERTFAKEYFLITAQYMSDTVLEQLPDAFRYGNMGTICHHLALAMCATLLTTSSPTYSPTGRWCGSRLAPLPRTWSPSLTPRAPCCLGLWLHGLVWTQTNEGRRCVGALVGLNPVA